MSADDTVDNDYVSRTGQKEHIPVQDDNAPVEETIEADPDSDKALEKDEAEAIDKSNIIEGRTRGAAKDSYREPGDEEGIPDEGTSSAA